MNLKNRKWREQWLDEADTEKKFICTLLTPVCLSVCLHPPGLLEGFHSTIMPFSMPAPSWPSEGFHDTPLYFTDT